MKNSKIIFICLIIIILYLFSALFPEASAAKTRKWSIPEFDQQTSLSDQIVSLKKSVDLAVNQWLPKLGKITDSSKPSRQINFYLRNRASSDFIITDIIARLDQQLTHYNFSSEDAGVFYQNTVKKFSISGISRGKHVLRFKFLEVNGQTEERRPPSIKRKPVKTCSFLSDAQCLHKNPLADTRVIKECSFNFSSDTDSIIVSFNDSDVPKMLAMPTKPAEKLQIDIETARGFFLNQRYLACLWKLNAINFSPLWDEILFLKAECFFHLEMYTEAIQGYRQLLRKFPHSGYKPLSMLRTEMAHYRSGQYRLAVLDYQKFGPKIDTKIFDPARYIAAKSYYQQKDLAQAEHISIPSESLYYLPAQYLRAQGRLAVHQYDAAIKILQDAESIISSKLKNGRADSPQTTYLTLSAALPSPEPFPIMKKIMAEINAEIDTVRLLQSAHLLLGKLLYQQKQYEMAMKEFKAIPPDSSHHLAALTGQGLIFIRLHQEDKIKGILNEFPSQVLENRFLSDARFTLADCALQRGEYQQAYRFYQDSIDRCQNGLSEIEQIKKDAAKNLFDSSYMNTRLPPTIDAQKVPSFSQWDTLIKREKILQAMKDLLVASEPIYRKKIRLFSKLRSGVDPHQDQQAAYKKIIKQEKQIRQIKSALKVQLQKEVNKSLGTISHQLSEIKDRAVLETEMAKFREKFSPPSVENLAALSRVIKIHESFIEKYPHSPYLEKILFQLAESYYQKALLDFQQQFASAQVSGKEQEKAANFLLKSRPNFDMAIKIYEKILLQFPHGHYTQKTLYALAYAYQDQGAIILARSLFKRLVNDFPDSSFTPEVLLRLGEIFFDENNYAQAARYYERAVNEGQIPKQYKNNVLYKLGWSYYKQNQSDKALNLFIALADEYERTDKSIMLEDMSYQLAKMGSDYDSFEQAQKMLSRLKKKSYYFQVLKKMAGILFNQARFEQAIKAYQLAIKQYPLAPKAPVFQSRIEQGYLKLNRLKAANTARENLVTNYGENTPWWEHNKGKEIRKQVSSLIDQSIQNSSLYLLKSKNKKDYQDLISFYRQNLKLFPSAEQAYKITFLLGECLYKTEQYKQALSEYERILQEKNFDEFTEDAAYKQILCLEKTVFPANAGELRPEEKKFLTACNYLAQSFPKHKHLPEVLYKEGELYLKKNLYPEAIDIFKHIIQQFPDAKIRTATMKMLAKAYFSQKQFNLAAQLYSKIVHDCDQKLKTKAKTRVKSTRRNAFKMIALSRYKEAESLLDQGQPIKAAKKFKSTAKDFPGVQTADLALFEAAKIYQTQSGYSAEAIKTFSRLLKKYPQSEYAPQALLQIALEREKNKQFRKAAESYEKLYLDYPKFAESSRALYQAGRLYEKVKNWPKVIKIFSAYQSELHPEPALAIELDFRRGYAFMKKGDSFQAEAAFQVVLDTYERYKAQGKIPPYYPAWAQFLISEQIFAAYDKAQIHEKLGLLKKVLENYTRAANFKIAKWTIPATFKMGLAMDKFVESLENKPESDSAYLLNIQLQQKIIKFLEKARLLYQKNIKLAQKNQIHDTWIAKSWKNLTKDYWKAGQVYEKIYWLIKEAPVPQILDKSQAQSYRRALLVKALPYQNQAIEMYAQNTGAFTAGIEYNCWIKQSYQRLAVLRPEKYLRNEERPLAENQLDLSFPDHLLFRE